MAPPPPPLLLFLGGGWTVARAYTALAWTVVALYVCTFFGILTTLPTYYVEGLAWSLTAMVSVVLMYLFAPTRTTRYELSDGDDALIFGCATLLFTNVVLTGAMRLFAAPATRRENPQHSR